MYLKKAKKVVECKTKPCTTMTIKDAFLAVERGQALVERPKVAVPAYQPRRGKTSHYPHFCTTKNTQLVKFRESLASLDGDRKNPDQCKQIAEDVSKYHYFANNSKIDKMTIVDCKKMNEYATQLFEDGVELEGVITKLERMRFFTDFLTLNSDLSGEEAERMQM